MAETDVETILDRLSGRRLGPDDVKARRYVGAFFNRRRLGAKIIAEVEGNHGTYTVSLDAGGEQPQGGCSCYLGAGGGCHHVRALAQTLLEEPASFVALEIHTRHRLRSLVDLAKYLETTSLEDLLADLEALGVKRQQVGRVLGANSRTLTNAVRNERRNDLKDTAGALRLACLYLLEWSEAAASDEDVARTLAWRSRRELIDLIGELVERLDPGDRRQFLARLGSEPESPGGVVGLHAERLLGDIERFVRDCEEGIYYTPEGDDGDYDDGSYYDDNYEESDAEPDARAVGLLDDLLARTEQHHQAGDDATAVAAYEKLFGVLWGDTVEMFGIDEVEWGLESDVRQAVRHYLTSLGRICRPEEYAQRAWHRMGWEHTDLLVTESSPEQQAALEAYLLTEIAVETGENMGAPTSLYQLRDLYRHQGRGEEEVALYLSWRHRWPELLAPLMDHAEQTGDWTGLESLAWEALEELGRGRTIVPYGNDRQELERRLGRALERQGNLEGALACSQRAFAARPDLEGYRRMSELAGRISPEHCSRAAAEAIDLLRGRVSPERMSPYDSWALAEARLLAQVLLAEGRHTEAYDLAMAARGHTQISLLTLVGNAYLTSGWGESPASGSVVRRALDRDRAETDLPAAIPGEVGRDEALSRAGECYHRLVQMHLEARNRDSYATAASHAAVMREIYGRRGRRADFDRWHAELMGTHLRFRALREEFRRALGKEPDPGDLPA